MKINKLYTGQSSDKGFSLLEVAVVMGVMSIIAAFALPQLAATRRAVRWEGITKEFVTQLRFARQQAISQKVNYVFEYNHNERALIVSKESGEIVRRTSLIGAGLSSSDLSYGLPSGVPDSAKTLTDKTQMADLSSGKLKITFYPNGQSDRSVAFYIYSNNSPKTTARAISVLGATGRAKTWRYNNTTASFIE
jgi:prepilin-type N-terminal cleavage/methylation domain-containing protein